MYNVIKRLLILGFFYEVKILKEIMFWNKENRVLFVKSMKDG